MEQNLPTTQTTALRPERRLPVPKIYVPDTVRGFIQNRKAMLGTSIMLFFICVALFAPTLPPFRAARS
jgi:ABC-type antimicrobial peptide transport system permease subunit